MFAEKGFAATTVRDIAKRSGVSQRTVFRHFRTKADIAVSEGRAELDRLRDYVRSWPKEVPLVDAIAEITMTYAAVLASDPRASATRKEYATDPTLKRRRLEMLYVEYPELLAEDLAFRDGAATPGPHHLLAARVLAAILGAAIDEWLARPDVSMQEEVQESVGVLRRMFRETG